MDTHTLLRALPALSAADLDQRLDDLEAEQRLIRALLRVALRNRRKGQGESSREGVHRADAS